MSGNGLEVIKNVDLEEVVAAMTPQEIDEVLKMRRAIIESFCSMETHRSNAALMRASSNRHGFQAIEAAKKNREDGVEDPGIEALCKARQYADTIQAKNCELRAEQSALENQLYTTSFLSLTG